MKRVARQLAVVAILMVVGVVAPRSANVNAGLPAGIRSGEAVHWVPEEIDSLARLLRAEGAGKTDAVELAQIVHSESRALTLDPLYALALIKIESNFRANVVSSQGAVGLLQIRPAAARSVAVAAGDTTTGRAAHAARLRDPQTNVAVGLRYLQHLEDQFPDRATALAAYNLGPSYVRRRLERGAPVPRAYANRVLVTYRALAEATSASPADPVPRS